jgi:UDPglucose 6-dehydrogenase
MRDSTVVVIKSTVPVGTDEVDAIIRKLRPEADFAVVSNSEFLREGAAIEDFKRPDRVVVGTDDERARRVMRELYRPLTGRRAAELIKYAANAFLATKITFINEMADCARNAAPTSRRSHAAWASIAASPASFCMPDLVSAARASPRTPRPSPPTVVTGTPIKIVETVFGVNDARKRTMAAKVVAACGGSLAGKTVAVLGLTFKPNTDDMREARSLVIVPALEAEGARVCAYDPHGMQEARKLR